MASPTSSSEPGPSSSFDLLHPALQRWAYDQGWKTLRDAQERAIGPIITGDCDIIIAAATAAGKTEAAFLPILSAIATDAEATDETSALTVYDPWADLETGTASGVQVLCLSPLKALINDQFQRLEQLCERASITVHRWHGDVSESSKRKLRSHPSGVLLITPESLEALFVNRGTQIPRLLAGLRYIVIDELHSFIAEQRGAQVQSLMNRVELAIRRQVPRVGLSATLGDMAQAAAFIRPVSPETVEIIEAEKGGAGIRLQVRGYTASPPAMSPKEVRAAEQAGRDVSVEATVTKDRNSIAGDLFETLRGQDNLIFANARGNVELYADLLARTSDRLGIPNEFWPHHGNLSKNIRETVEAYLKDRSRPATAVCTSTLEMGIDIGTVESIAQIGPPPSVAALRQRLGRSGRRGGPSVIRLYISENPLNERSGYIDQLRCGIVQTTAMVRLMLDRWLETPDDPGFNYSTLIQQIMSAIAQHGGATPLELYRALCGPGPFRLVDQTRFALLLRAMAARDLLIQASDGLLLHGTAGERHVNHYSFYAAFQTLDEWRLTAAGKTLGTVPISQPLYEGTMLIFAGRRWKVTDINPDARVITMEPSTGGTPPVFDSGTIEVSDRVRTEMTTVYQSTDEPPWLNPAGEQLLTEGRETFDRLGLGETTALVDEPDVLLFPWMGDRAMHTAAIALRCEGIEANVEGPAIRLSNTSTEEALDAIRVLTAGPPPTPTDLAHFIENPEIDKWDWALDEDLARESAGSRLLDIDGAWVILAKARQDIARTSKPTQTPSNSSRTTSNPG